MELKYINLMKRSNLIVGDSLMVFDFFIMGTVFIWSVFYLKINSVNKFLFLVSNMAMILSYFCSFLFIKSLGISVNLLVLISMILYMLFLFRIGKNVNYKSIFENVFCVLIAYVLLNLISVEFGSYFNVIPLIVVELLVNIANSNKMICSILGLNISLIVVEIFSCFYMFNKLSFASLFGREFVICVVVLNVVMWVYFKFFELVRNNRYEKIS